jgi:probable phosphoglycerate mutase
MQPVTTGSAPDVRTSLFFVRHGLADSNVGQRFGGWSPAPLTEFGHRQAHAAGAALRARAPTAIVSSDIVRAHQTAEAIAAALALPIEAHVGLRERSVGIFDGMSFAEAQAQHPAEWARLIARDPDVAPGGGETVDAVFARVSAAVDDIVRRHAGGRVVVVTHGIALFHAFAHVCGLGSPRGVQRVFVLADNASISHIEHRTDDGDEHWRIHSLNDIAHLAGVD